MLCKACNTEMMIDRTEFLVVGDQSASTETELYNVPIFKCGSKSCTANNQPIRGEPIRLPLVPT